LGHINLDLLKNEFDIEMVGSCRYILRFLKNSDWLELSTGRENVFEVWKEALSKYCVQNAFNSKFVILEVLGEGAYGTVHLVQNMKTKEQFAAKAFCKMKMRRDSKKRLLKNEIKVMRRLDHENILKVYEVHETSDTIFIILEYIRDGELLNYLKKTKKVQKKTMKGIMTQLLTAVEYLNERGFIHRDIKPENVMYAVTEEGEMLLKLADFGLSCSIDHKSNFEAGTPGYMAPEIVNPKKYPEKWRLTPKCDIFSLGCMFYQMYYSYDFRITRQDPFKKNKNQSYLEANKAGVIDMDKRALREFSARGKASLKAGKELLKRMLHQDPRKRISVYEALDHPYLTTEITQISVNGSMGKRYSSYM
jgi:calcium-dependent protein kinase